MNKLIEEKNKIEKEFNENFNLYSKNKKINEQLEKDIKSKSKELEKIKKRVNEESTFKNYIRNKDKLKTQYEKIIEVLKENLTKVENEITIRRNDFIAFNAQLNEEINKKIKNEKPEEKNKNIEKPTIYIKKKY